MIPILYEQTEKQFTSGGLGFLADCTSFKVTQERNGIFECEFTYPITGPLYDQIQERRIVYATHDDSGDPQPFDIYARSAPIDGLVTFYAHHISYRLSNSVVMPFTATGIADAMTKIQANIVTDRDDDFTFWTDKTTTGDYAKTVPSIVRTTLGGEEGSLLDVYGRGDYEFDKFAVRLYQNKGRDTDVEIRYGKNLTSINHKVDNGESYNAIVPYWLNEETGALRTLPEGYLSYDDGTAYIVAIPFSMNEYFETMPTVAAMRQKAQQLLDSSEAWVPSEGFEVNFVQLWQTEEYKDYAPLQRVNLCDTVRVYYPELGVDAVRERVVKTVYNTLLDRYDEITLNELPTTLTGLTQQQISVETSGNVTAEGMRAEINLAVQLVRGGLGGYIAMPADQDGLPQLIYLLDQPDVDEALNVIRLGSDGISRSSTGIDGPFTSIISMNGAITGNLTGNVTGNLTGNVSVVISGTTLAQLLGMALGNENVAVIKATNPFALVNGSGALGYRYGGSAGSGSYGAPHYFSGNVIIDGDLTVTGTITQHGGSE